MLTLPQTIRRALLALLALVAPSLTRSQAWSPGQPIPSAAEIFGGALTPDADKYLTSSNVEFNAKQSALHATWLQDVKRFDIDMQQARLRLQKAGSTVTFDVQFAGSHKKSGSTWEWAWNNPNVAASIATASLKARAIGEKYQLRYVTSGMVPVPDDRFPWFLSALVSKESNALGVFRAPGGGIDYYFVLFNPRTNEP